MAQSDAAAPQPSSNLLPMTVAQMAFLIDRLYDDCSPLQFLRELTKNAIEAVSGSDMQGGEIRWDLDWNRFDVTEERITKLCVIDNGCGMTGDEMVKYINQLSSSIHKQSKTGNYGVGAKITAAPANPAGLVYLSWKDGKGYMIHLLRDPVTEQYGLMRFEKTGQFWAHISDDVKPEPIKDHGTMVILLGTDEAANTMAAPAKAAMPRKWVLRYLNQRFFRFPDNVTVKAREGWDLPRGDKHNFLRTVTGMGKWLDDSSQASGSVRLTDSSATAHWWIIKADADTDSGHYPPNGHVAALYQDELYELVHGNAGYARLQNFGVVFGCDRVVIYLEPDYEEQEVASNTSRTQLLIHSEPLDWSAYAKEFRDKMPEELAAFQDEIGQHTRHTDHRAAIRERLKTIRELFRFGRYRPKTGGAFLIKEPSENTGGDPRDSTSKLSGGAKRGGGSGGRQGDIYALFTEEVGDPAELVSNPIEPQVSWRRLEDGTRSQGDLDDRAARYLPESNLLLINGDFRAFTDMVDRWATRYAHVAGAKNIIKQTVEEWFEQQLIETIMSAWALKQAGGWWSTEELARLWSPESLTAAVLPRYHIDMNIKRNLGQRLGKLPTAA